MSRRTRSCLACAQRTRHDDQVCAACRRRGVTRRNRTLRAPLTLRFLPKVENPNAPTREELAKGIDLTKMLQSSDILWPGR